MARKPTFGTPHQSKTYIAPSKRRGRFLACWIGVALVAVAVTGDALTSRSLLVSPGSLSRNHLLPPGHAAAVSDCARCHDPFSAPTDARRVRCPEPRAPVSRLANRAHAEPIQDADRRTPGARHPA